MGVTCQIHLKRPLGGDYIPGSTVEGTVRYSIGEDTVYKGIDVIFKGFSMCKWVINSTVFIGTETILKEVKDILEKKENGEVLIKAGIYSVPFNFVLPYKIPPTYKDDVCFISYYITLKLTQPGKFNTTKKFKTKIPVACTVEATNTEGKLMYGLRKEVSHIFGKSNEVISLKATLSKSLLVPGEKLDIVYDITNDTSITIQKITTNLVEFLTYTAKYGAVKTRSKKIRECKTTIESIDAKQSNKCEVVVPTLAGMCSIQHSKVLSRDYRVVISVKLPMPHRNARLEIPLDIGCTPYDTTNVNKVTDTSQLDESPPDYWELMEEETKDSSLFKEDTEKIPL